MSFKGTYILTLIRSKNNLNFNSHELHQVDIVIRCNPPKDSVMFGHGRWMCHGIFGARAGHNVGVERSVRPFPNDCASSNYLRLENKASVRRTFDSDWNWMKNTDYLRKSVNSLSSYNVSHQSGENLQFFFVRLQYLWWVWSRIAAFKTNRYIPFFLIKPKYDSPGNSILKIDIWEEKRNKTIK